MPTGDTRANEFLDAVYGDNRSALFPATVHVAFYSVAPTSAGGGVQYGARVAVANTSAEWPDATDREKTNANRISWPTPVADTPELVAVAIHGHATDDDILHWEVLEDPISALAGEPLFIEEETLIITVPE